MAEACFKSCDFQRLPGGCFPGVRIIQGRNLGLSSGKIRQAHLPYIYSHLACITTCKTLPPHLVAPECDVSSRGIQHRDLNKCSAGCYVYKKMNRLPLYQCE